MNSPTGSDQDEPLLGASATPASAAARARPTRRKTLVLLLLIGINLLNYLDRYTISGKGRGKGTWWPSSGVL